MTDGASTVWLMGRALLALLLTIGFYALLLLAAGLLFWIPIAEWQYLHRIDLRIAIFCLASGATLLWNAIPQRDHFVAPGPMLAEYECPALFQLIKEVATETRQELPSRVFLLNDVNAFVAVRGSRLGFGGERVMGIGLPLIQSLTVSELRAVVAHEFGHFWGGDLKLGPWIHQTHSSISRTVEHLGRNILAAPFAWYNEVFLRLTRSVSRRQEFVADAVSARVAGRDAASSALKRVALASSGFGWYMQEEVIPCLHAGFLPPIATGFTHFVRAERVRTILANTPSSEPRRADAHDTHPPLDARLANLAALSSQHEVATNEAWAASLIGNPDALAIELLRFTSNVNAINKLKRIDWADVGERVVGARWHAVRTSFAPVLGTIQVDALPTGTQATVAAGRRLIRPGENPPFDRDVAVNRAIEILGSSLGALLLADGWTLRTSPGEPKLLVRGQVKGQYVINPFGVVSSLAKGTGDLTTWRQQCAVLGLVGRALSPATPS